MKSEPNIKPEDMNLEEEQSLALNQVQL